MSGPFGSSQFMYATGAEEGQSLRFEDGDSAYMTRTPASAGNRRIWTFSAWIKRGNITSNQGIFGAESSGDRVVLGFGFGGTDQVRFYSQSPSTDIYTTAVLRDPSAWYNIVWAVDTTQATSTNRIKIYVNGEQITSFTSASYPAQNSDYSVNNTVAQYIGRWAGFNGEYLDGYLANVCLIDGQQLDPTSFGEYQDTLWKPKSDDDITGNLTFGTNGFYLPFKQTTEAEGFSTVTYTGSGADQSIKGVGFSPDLVWLKARNDTGYHYLFDTNRGALKDLYSNDSIAEYSASETLKSFDTDGFSVGNNTGINGSGDNVVAWCWDAGTGSAVSNTDGSITSTVKANTAKGFSIVTGTTPSSYTSYSFGHGLTSAPEFVIWKERGGTSNWNSWHTGLSSSQNMIQLNTTTAEQSGAYYGTIDSSVVTQAAGAFTNLNSDFVAYCFHSVSGYSSIGSYTGTGASGNSVTLGFEPAFVMIKRSDASGDDWVMVDTTRSPVNPRDDHLTANSSAAETSGGNRGFDTSATGFTINHTGGAYNTSGGTYIYMAFADTRDATFFGDTSGNQNNWTPNALNNTDVMLDSPVTGDNFATMNPLDKYLTNVTLSEGNLQIDTSASNVGVKGTYFVNSGKWYYEARVGNASGVVTYGAATSSWANTYVGNTGSYGYLSNGFIYVNGSAVQSSLATATTGDIIGIALNMDDNEITFYKNNTQIGTTVTGLADEVAPAFAGQVSSKSQVNFGQDSSFAGNETPQGNTDDNGVGDFYYAPPSGYLALTTGNLPTPTITAPDEYFNTVLYTGTGSQMSITGVGFQPDFFWNKSRSTTGSNAVNDSVRGANARLNTESTAAETTQSGFPVSYDSDGVTLNSFITSGKTYVLWNWKAGGTAASNTDGSITSQVSANQTAGFSVVGYTGNGVDGASVGHSLNSQPEMIIVKKRDGAQNWGVYHKDLPSFGILQLNLTNANYTGSNVFNDQDPSSSVFYLGDTPDISNTNGSDYIAYCFHSVEGYSKIGSYTGNGSTDGTFVHCGFRPAFLMVKRTDATNNWLMLNNKTPGYNKNSELYANLSNAETTASDRIDLLSNGFKSRINSTTNNGSGATYIFIAFAEAPFKSANAR